MGVLHTPSRHTFECDGTQRVFPIPSFIISHDFVRIEIDGVLQSDRKQWDIVNNSLVFVEAPISGAILDVQVASDSEALGELGMLSNVDILAQNITDVNKVANIDTDVTTVANIDLDVTTVAGIVSEIPIVSAIATDVTTVAGISSEVITVANIDTDVTKVANIDTKVTTVADNILDIQNAEENSIIAKEEAWRAEAERLTANSYATEPEDVYVKIYTSNNDGTFTVTNTTDYSSYHWERKATTLVTTGVIDDVTSSPNRTYSSNKIDGIVNTINNNITTIVTDNITPIENSIGVIEGDIVALEDIATALENDVSTLDNTTVKLTGNQTIEDVKTFISSPIVPTPTTDLQVATKKYVDDKTINTLNNQNVLQVVYAENKVVGSGSLTVPIDGTIPQITEGNEILTCTITPKKADSRLLIEFTPSCQEVTNTGNVLTVACFINGASNALYQTITNHFGNVQLTENNITGRFIINTPSTSSLTFSLRAGMDVGATHWNQFKYGPALTPLFTTMTITEIV